MSVTLKCSAILIALAFCAGTVRGDQPKTYRITLSSVSTIRTVQFQPGEYKLVVDTHDPKVHFTELATGLETDLEAKVETIDEKYENTAIHSDRSGGASRIIEIRIGGTKTRVQFN